MGTLENLLLQRTYKDGPLFKKRVDIVKAILSTSGTNFYTPEEDSEYKKRFNNLKVYISQIIDAKRAASKDLIHAFKIIIREKLDSVSEIDVDEVLGEFDELIHKSSSKIFVPGDVQWEFDQLNEKIHTAVSQITFCSRPIETFDNQKSQIFLDRVLERLHVIESKSKYAPTILSTIYEYYVSEQGMAFLFYKTLFDRARFQRDISIDQLCAVFKHLNQSVLKVYVVQPSYCTFRQIVLNHQTLKPAGFIVFTHGDHFSVSRISSSGMQRWMSDIYMPSLLERREVKFEEFIEKLII